MIAYLTRFLNLNDKFNFINDADHIIFWVFGLARVRIGEVRTIECTVIKF